MERLTIPTSKRLTVGANKRLIVDRPWSPTQLGATLALWLDAQDSTSITLNGSTVAAWNDRSSNGRNFTQGTGALQPTYSATVWDGLPGIVHSGTGPYLEAGSNWTANLMSFYIVSQRTNASPQTQTLWGSSWTGDYAPIANSTQGANTQIFRFNSVNDPAQLSSYFNGTSIKEKNSAPTTGRGTIFTSMGTKNIFGIIGTPSLGATPRLGYESTYRLAGTIVEVVGTTTDSGTSERQLIEGYLAWKWGTATSLPVDHPYKTYPPTV